MTMGSGIPGSERPEVGCGQSPGTSSAAPKWRLERHREVGSTSDLAKVAPVWTVVVAERQTRGRGRLGREWHSPPGGLWLSAAVPPPVPAQGTVARRVAEALGALTGLPVRYQPPNDLVLLGKKLGGVLVEATFRGGEPEKAVIGVGVNVNNPARDFPVRLRGEAISLLEALGERQDLERVLWAVLGGIEAAWEEERCRLSR